MEEKKFLTPDERFRKRFSRKINDFDKFKELLNENRPGRSFSDVIIIARNIFMFVFLGVLAVRIALLKFDLSGADLPEVLTFIVSFFAITLSVLFYFKANETSNKFYDNMLKFTQDTSVTLTKIQSSFGEQLKHIGQGYDDVRDKVDELPTRIADLRNGISNKEEKVEKTEQEKEQMINDLIEKTTLNEQQKVQYRLEIKKKDQLEENLKLELNSLKMRLNQFREQDRQSHPSLHSGFHLSIREFISFLEGIPKNTLENSLGDSGVLFDLFNHYNQSYGHMVWTISEWDKQPRHFVIIDRLRDIVAGELNSRLNN